MNSLIEFYVSNKNWIDLIRDGVFFASAITLFTGFGAWLIFLSKKRFTDISAAIKSDLELREKLEPLLIEHILTDAKNNMRDTAIRFVHWKNYPRQLEDDGYKEHLWIKYHRMQPLIPFASSCIDNTGVFIQSHLWFYGLSVYVDKNKYFFLDSKDRKIKGFQEFSDCVIVYHLPFTNIVNFDFKEYIEHEPVFYIKYRYTKRRKLFDDQIFLRKSELREEDKFNYLNLELSQKNWMKKYSLRRVLIRCKLYLFP